MELEVIQDTQDTQDPLVQTESEVIQDTPDQMESEATQVQTE